MDLSNILLLVDFFEEKSRSIFEYQLRTQQYVDLTKRFF